MILTFDQKKEALNNALTSFKFPDKYFIKNAFAGKQKFAIASKNEAGRVEIHTLFLTYEEMNCFLMGYNKAVTNPFK